MSRVLVLAGGPPHAHDFGAIGTALTELAANDGHDVARVEHPDEAAAHLQRDDEARVDAMFVDALWWRMRGEQYDAWRDEFAYSTPTTTRQAFTSFVRRGGGLVAIHTAPICFDDWPGWGDLVGGSWRWGTSAHPPYGSVHARIVANHDVTAGLPGEIDLTDEVYGDLDVRADATVLAVARRHDGDDDQPVVWTHRCGAGRVVFNCFGHDAQSIRHPHNRRLLSQALTWTLGSDG